MWPLHELAAISNHEPPFFCASFFPFFWPCPPHPSPANFLAQNPLFLGPQIYSFQVFGTVLDGVAPQGKKDNFSVARKKVRFRGKENRQKKKQGFFIATESLTLIFHSLAFEQKPRKTHLKHEGIYTPLSPAISAAIPTLIFNSRKNPPHIKIKLACPPPLPKNPRTPSLKRGILWTWGFSSRKNQKCQAPIKLAQPVGALELRVGKLRTWGLFCNRLGGVSKCEQTQTNADKRWQTQANAEAENASKRGSSKRSQTQTNAYTPLYCVFLHPPPCNPFRESPKLRFSQKTADVRRFTPSRGNQVFWGCRIFAESCWFSQETADWGPSPYKSPLARPYGNQKCWKSWHSAISNRWRFQIVAIAILAIWVSKVLVWAAPTYRVSARAFKP